MAVPSEVNYYTYAFLRKDGTPYYIGKGSNGRIWETRNRFATPPKDKSKIIYLKQNLTEEEAFRHEIYMIAVYGRKNIGTGILHNLTEGGEGSSGRIHSEETRYKISNSKKGKKQSPEAIAKSAAANRGMKRSQEARANMSAAQRRWRETNPNIVRKDSPETLAKKSAAHTGRKHSPETIEKMRASAIKRKKRKPFSQEARANMSAAQKKAKAKGKML